ncbi:MAG: radical SAM protein, partial [archaeon]
AFFYDDNLCADKQRAINLFSMLEKENRNLKWSCQVRCDAAQDEKLLKKMAGAGCQIAFIGFESVSQKTLDSYNKSQSIADIKNAIRKFHDYGIKVHGMFVLGSDEDDKSIFRATVNFCNNQDIDSVQYLILTPAPGTQLYQNLNAQNRLLHKKWQFYDGMHVVFKPKNFNPVELQEGVIDCYQDFYTYSKALNGAVNVVYDSAINCLKSSGEKLRRYFPKNWDTTLLGKYIIKKWLNQNKNYSGYLNRLSQSQNQSSP